MKCMQLVCAVQNYNKRKWKILSKTCTASSYEFIYTIRLEETICGRMVKKLEEDYNVTSVALEFE